MNLPPTLTATAARPSVQPEAPGRAPDEGRDFGAALEELLRHGDTGSGHCLPVPPDLRSPVPPGPAPAVPAVEQVPPDHGRPLLAADVPAPGFAIGVPEAPTGPGSAAGSAVAPVPDVPVAPPEKRVPGGRAGRERHGVVTSVPGQVLAQGTAPGAGETTLPVAGTGRDAATAVVPGATAAPAVVPGAATVEAQVPAAATAHGVEPGAVRAESGHGVLIPQPGADRSVAPVPASTAPAAAVAPPAAVAHAAPAAVVAPAAPVVAPAAPAVAQAAPVPTSAAAPSTPPPLSAQLGAPLLKLVTAPTGEHVMTVRVTPEELGPVTVRATVTPEGVRIELFAPSEAGREAVRSMLPDLRRDLAGSGPTTQLDLSAHDEPDQSPRDSPEDRRVLIRQPVQSGAPEALGPNTPRPGAATATLDVLA